jgi:DDE superfamily endonuclease
MEAILDLYAQPYDESQPVVCVDERPCVLRADKVPPQPMQPGQPERYDYEYVRQGQCNLFMAFQAAQGWRHTQVTKQRTKLDFAHFIRDLIDVHFPHAETIHLVLDNLNTHTPAALYEAFEPEEARRLTRKLIFHYTPKHASWLNMVEIELAVLVKQCIPHRVPDQDTLDREITAWRETRNAQRATINWLFRVTDARTRLVRFYPRQSLW